MLLFSSHCLQAQVNIGSGQTPHNFSILELTSNSKGLRLTQLSTFQRNQWSDYFLGRTPNNPANPSSPGYISASDKEHARGLVIYNTDTGCLEYWNTQKWVSLCAGCAEITSASISGGTTITRGTTTAVTLTATTVPARAATAYVWYLGGVSVDTTTVNTYNVPQSVKDVAATYEYRVKAINTCSEADGTNQANVVVIPVAPSSITISGSFTGRTIFDIAKGNNGGVYGNLAARRPYSTDFANLQEQDATDGTPAVIDPSATGTWLYSGRQVYTFTPSAAVSNVRFTYVEDASLEAIVSMTPKAVYSGNIAAGTACKAVVVYRPDLMTTLIGKTRDDAVKPKLYAIYNDQPNGAGTDYAVELTVSLQDCNCCGAYVIGGWENFLCYNLGANFMLDPFTYKSIANNNSIKGDFYQWGRQRDGHEKRNSNNYPTNNTVNENGAVPDAALDASNNQVLSSHAAYGKFIKGYDGTNYRYDWRQIQNDYLWSNGISNYSTPKVVANDPCPPGWKVPSTYQLGSIYHNVWKWTSNGYMVGDALYLPVTGQRAAFNGRVSDSDVDPYGYYWTSTINPPNSHFFRLGDGDVVNTSSVHRSLGHAVRCIAE
ncbi:hypothetical protein FACS189426_09270 [Bacteroidia bacterium]|nr:hypothetical protein FACS189426_09270 [Bacteroidia bacterium]